MSFRETLRVALGALRSNGLRSALTVLGVLIGVMSVVVLVAVGQGARDEVTGAIEGLGSNLLFVLPGDGQFTAAPARSRFTLEDVDRVDRALAGSGRTAGTLLGGEALRAEGQRTVGTVTGVTAGYFNVLSLGIARGQALNDSDVLTGRRVVLLGAAIADDLFATSDPIGRSVTIGGTRFRIVGVMDRVGGGAFGPDRNREVYLPISAAQRLFNTNRLDGLVVRSTSTDSVATDRAVVEQVLGTRLDDADFTVLSQDDIIGVVGDILEILTLVLAAIAGISLLVGGVGVSNIMLVSVTERTREIGLRMAVGARPRDITRQFLAEAIALTSLGGLVGLLVGVTIATVVPRVSPLPARITGWSIALSLGVSIGVGIIFGVLPARRAGRLEPVEALRHHG